jgi:hypothetical protein
MLTLKKAATLRFVADGINKLTRKDYWNCYCDLCPKHIDERPFVADGIDKLS